MSVTLVIPGQDLHIGATEAEARRLAAARGVPADAGHVIDGADRHGRFDAWEAEADRVRLWVNEWETPLLFTADDLREIADDVARVYFGVRS